MEGMEDLWDGLPSEQEEWLSNLRYSNFDTLAAPAFTLFSVSVNCNSFAQGKLCEVYGKIEIEDAQGSCCDVYHRKPDDSETVSPDDNTLSVDMPLDGNTSKPWVRIRISLKDKADDSVIVEHVFGLDTLVQDYDYDRVRVQQVHGLGGSVSVSYAVLQVAVVGVVHITLIRNDQTDAPRAADLYGKIVASCGNTYGKRFPQMLLFKKLPNQSIRAVSQIPFEMSRDELVVPAYSFLRFELDLWDRNANCQVVHGKAEFLAVDMHRYSQVVQGKDFHVDVTVYWDHPYTCEKKVEEQLLKRPKIQGALLTHPEQSISSGLTLRKHEPMGFPFVEVFTVMVGPNTTTPVSVYGVMKVRNKSMLHTLFDTDEKSPEPLSAGSRTISIAGPSQILDEPEDLAMSLDLKDVQGRIAINGNIGWDSSLINMPFSWYDRRICSLIRGLYGYAVVHYMMFSRAVQAMVKVSFVSYTAPHVGHRVHGKIDARYSNHNYSSEYERAYYQSILFKELPESRKQLRSGCTIQLLKSLIAVPRDAVLILEFDLYASSLLNGVPEEHITGVAEFKIDPDANVCPVIQGENYGIQASIEWSNLYL